MDRQLSNVTGNSFCATPPIILYGRITLSVGRILLGALLADAPSATPVHGAGIMGSRCKLNRQSKIYCPWPHACGYASRPDELTLRRIARGMRSAVVCSRRSQSATWSSRTVAAAIAAFGGFWGTVHDEHGELGLQAGQALRGSRELYAFGATRPQ